VHWNPISPTRNNVAHLQPSAAFIAPRKQRLRASGQALTIWTAEGASAQAADELPLNHFLSAHPINWPWRFRSRVAWAATGSSLTPKLSHDNP
jgi:hypothetical protein